jgi:ectoine hydroxylase-related dioxygenase (phytanoyl-CoA dioxygenase family)
MLNKGHSSQHSLVQLRPHQIIDEKEFLEKNQEKIFKSFEKLFLNKLCFAPYVPLGSVVIFERRVIHGTYVTKTMNKPRYSLDCRFTGTFNITKLNRMYSGRLYPNIINYPNSRIHRMHTLINNQIQKLKNLKQSEKFIKVFRK